jgi:GNAT superfamily N-acetyltransferase
VPEIRSYRKPDVPRDIAVQIVSGVRFVWPQVFGKSPPLWESTPYPADGMHFVLIDGDLLISHALATSRKLAQAGETFNVYGLSSVFTFPTHRGAGAGEKVVAAATDYIRQRSDADFALLFCGERVKSLYQRLGWEAAPGMKVTYGDNQTYADGYALTLYVSDRARAHRFVETEPLHVGKNTW